MSTQVLIGKTFEVIYTDGTGMQHKQTWTLRALDDSGFVVFEDPSASRTVLIPKRRIDQLTLAEE